MKKTTTLGVCLLLTFALTGHAQTINTIAGVGYGGYSGDGGPSTSAVLGVPTDVKVDASGNLYFVDQLDNVVRKINTSGTISTVAGDGYGYTTGTGGFSGDGGPAISAEMYAPFAMAFDKSGNMYICDQANHRVRKVNTSGTISTFAGNGSGTYSGDGGPATSAGISPDGIAVDASGNVYIADGSNRIRVVNTSGTISTFAGNGTAGFAGDGGPATSAEFSLPQGLAFDAAGNLYIADNNNERIRKINTSGTISTVVGTGVGGYSGDGGLATSAQIWWPEGVAIDASGNLYFADEANNVIREVYAATGKIATVAGNGYGSGSGSGGYSGDGGPATSAELNEPTGVAVNGKSGMVYIADAINNRVRGYQGPVGINEITANQSVRVYPNPGNGVFTMSLQNVIEKAQVEVYNVIGEKVYQVEVNQGQNKINLTNEPSGVYMYRLVSEDQSVISTGRPIVQ
jgi:sugar lactone lactonase YvrE